MYGINNLNVYLQGVKPYQCGYCQHRTALRGNCNQHIKKHHPGFAVNVVDHLAAQRKSVKDYDYAQISGAGIEECRDVRAARWASIGNSANFFPPAGPIGVIDVDASGSESLASLVGSTHPLPNGGQGMSAPPTGISFSDMWRGTKLKSRVCSRIFVFYEAKSANQTFRWCYFILQVLNSVLTMQTFCTNSKIIENSSYREAKSKRFVSAVFMYWWLWPWTVFTLCYICGVSFGCQFFSWKVWENTLCTSGRVPCKVV